MLYSNFESMKKEIWKGDWENNRSKSYNKVIGTSTNNADEKIGTSKIYIFYYKNGKLVRYSSDLIFEIEDNFTRNFKFANPYNVYTWENIYHDDFKIVLNSAIK